VARLEFEVCGCAAMGRHVFVASVAPMTCHCSEDDTVDWLQNLPIAAGEQPRPRRIRPPGAWHERSSAPPLLIGSGRELATLKGQLQANIVRVATDVVGR
jgi:hypothetical protein